MKNECIELEYEKTYHNGYEEGIEVGRAIAVMMCQEVFESRTCRNCGWFDGQDCNRDGMLIVPKIISESGCGQWEAMDD